MKNVTVNTLGFELTASVPESVEEYNKLAPKRVDPCLEDAIWYNILHVTNTKFRDQFSEWLGKHTGYARIEAAEGSDDKDETQGAHIKRVLALVAKDRGLDPAAKATKEILFAEWTADAQRIMSGIKFDPSERESTGGAPALAKTYIAWASQAVQSDGGTKLAGLLSKVLGTTITLAGDPAADTITLARAIGQNEKRKRDAANAGGYNPEA